MAQLAGKPPAGAADRISQTCSDPRRCRSETVSAHDSAIATIRPRDPPFRLSPAAPE